MKNVQIIDGADNCTYDIFALTDDQFALIFPKGHDIAFIEEVYERGDGKLLDQTLSQVWTQRIRKPDAQGIHGTLFYELRSKSKYYPTRIDEEGVNPDGSSLRNSFA